MTDCRRCGQSKPEDGFYYVKGRRKEWCKECWNAYSGAWRKAHPEVSRRASRKRRSVHREEMYAATREWRSKTQYRKPDPSLRKCHNLLNQAVRSGRIQRPLNCERCGATSGPNGWRIEAHHRDHSKPYDVEWLCRPCHGLTRRLAV